MTLNTLSAFLTVVEEMNFTRAAQRLFITQQSLAGHIKRLEDEYGIKLFERRPSLHLTAEGENMAFYARQILNAQSMMIGGFADLSPGRTAYLDLGLSYLRSAMFGEGIWQEFHALHPNIQVRLVEANTEALLEKLQRGDITMMVGVDVRPVPGFRIIPLTKEPLCCLTDKSLYKKHCETDENSSEPKDMISIRDLEDMPLMIPAEGNRLRASLDRIYRSTGIKPPVVFESGRNDILCQLACEGEGAAILSPMVLFDRETGSLSVPDNCYFFRIREAGTSQLSVVVPEDIHIQHYTCSMIEVIRGVFAQYAEAVARLWPEG